MKDAVVTRMPHTGQRPSRNFEERLMVRFPGAWRTLAALGQRLFKPPSRLRRRWLRREIISGWNAASRRDYELMLVRYAPDVEFSLDPQFEALGLGAGYQGRGGMLRLINAFEEAWEGWRFVPELFIDFGDRLLVLGNARISGTASGIPFQPEFAQLMTIRGGLVSREEEFFGWDKALRAAGLESGAVIVRGAPASGGRAGSQ